VRAAGFIIILTGFLCLPAQAEIIPGQFVSWTDFSYITTIAIGNDFVYFGTTEGILRYHRYDRIFYDPITVSDGLPGRYIRRLSVTFDDQQLTAETDVGVYYYSNGLETWYLETSFPEERYRDASPKLPLPRLEVPFGYYMYPEGYIEDGYFRKYQITAWLMDNFNAIFAGTWGMGGAHIDDRTYVTEFLPYGLIQKITDAIYIDGDSIWAGGNPGDIIAANRSRRYGVSLYDRSRETFTYYEPRYIDGFNSETIYDIAGDSGNVYFAGRLGLTILTRKNGQFFTIDDRDGLPDRETTALSVAPDTVWIGTAHGLALYTPSVDTMVVVGRSLLGGRFITDLETAGDRLIIGTDRGAFYIDRRRRKIGRLRDPDGDLGGLIRHIGVDDEEVVISSDYGLTLVDIGTGKASKVPYINAAGGSYAAAINDTYIIAAVDNGLMLIERATQKRRLLDERDGLLSVRINTIVPEGDYLWIGSEEGLTRFQWNHPDRTD